MSDRYIYIAKTEKIPAVMHIILQQMHRLYNIDASSAKQTFKIFPK